MSIDKDQVEDWINHPVTEYIKTFMMKELEQSNIALINMAKSELSPERAYRELLILAQVDRTLDGIFNQIPQIMLQGESLYE